MTRRWPRSLITSTNLPALITVVQIDGKVDHDKVVCWADLEQQGADHLLANPTLSTRRSPASSRSTWPPSFTRRARRAGPRAYAWCRTAGPTRAWPSRNTTSSIPDDLQYLWLPLSHVFGKALIAIQLRIGFATAVDGRIDKIVENLGQVHPTFMAGAPRIFEKVRARVMTTAAHGRQGQDLRLGVRGRPEGHRHCGWPGRSPPGCSRSSTRWPTSWCSARSRPGWAARSGSSSPGPPR